KKWCAKWSNTMCCTSFMATPTAPTCMMCRLRKAAVSVGCLAIGVITDGTLWQNRANRSPLSVLPLVILRPLFPHHWRAAQMALPANCLACNGTENVVQVFSQHLVAAALASAH